MKIKYIDEDDMHLVVGAGNFELIIKGDIKEFSEEEAMHFLRDTKTVFIEKKKPKDGKPAEYEIKKIPKWELVEEKKEGK